MIYSIPLILLYYHKQQASRSYLHGYLIFRCFSIYCDCFHNANIVSQNPKKILIFFPEHKTAAANSHSHNSTFVAAVFLFYSVWTETPLFSSIKDGHSPCSSSNITSCASRCQCPSSVSAMETEQLPGTPSPQK